MIGNKIQELRKKNNLSQEDLASKIGVSRQTISNWELNITIPDLKEASKLSSILNISIDELTGNESILLKKVNNTESNSTLIIKLIKIMGITLGTLLFLLLVVVITFLLFKKYTEYNYSVNDITNSYERTCYYNGKLTTYYVTKNNTINEITLDFDDDEVKNYLLETGYKGSDPEDLLNEITSYIENNSGVCEKER